MAISPATKRNWKRLGTVPEGRLQARANKSRSLRRIIPEESVADWGTIAFLKRLPALCGEGGCSREELLCAIAMRLLERSGILERPGVQKILHDSGFLPRREISLPALPEGERDLLGISYQYLLLEGEKNRLGSYYTPPEAVNRMLEGWTLRPGDAFLDPCCGSGAFLLALPAADPEQLWGCDLDPVAVFLARINLLCRFPERDFVPRIFCGNFLREVPAPLAERKFFWIATNPPWGAKENSRQGAAAEESFSCFFRRAWEQLSPGGRIAFLFPDSLLTVGKHREFRTFLAETCRLEEVIRFDRLFSGVMTGYFALRAAKEPPQELFSLSRPGEPSRSAVRSAILRHPTKAFLFLSPGEEHLREKIESQKHYDLRQSRFALGIVTGDNARFLSSVPAPGLEAVYTGREIGRGTLAPPRTYLCFTPEQFQQTAPLELYRAPEKLLYRFIADRPVFALDRSRRLCLNSANLLIPEVPGMGILTVMAFLNSALFCWYYRLLGGGVKVLKSALQNLPFPAITKAQDRELSRLTEAMMDGNRDADAAIQDRIYAIFSLTPEEIRLVNSCL